MMKNLVRLIVLLALVIFASSARDASTQTENLESKNSRTEESLYSFGAKALDGTDAQLSDYRGKVVMVVNTASQCGFTPQYSDLQALYEEFQDQGFVVLGFPSNDFRNQEPASNEKIMQFCKLRYGVTFPMFEKNPVSGKEKQSIYRFLTENSDEEFRGEITWNFEKFLLDKSGRVKSRYGSMTSPQSPQIKDTIKRLLSDSSS